MVKKEDILEWKGFLFEVLTENKDFAGDYPCIMIEKDPTWDEEDIASTWQKFSELCEDYTKSYIEKFNLTREQKTQSFFSWFDIDSYLKNPKKDIKLFSKIKKNKIKKQVYREIHKEEEDYIWVNLNLK